MDERSRTLTEDDWATLVNRIENDLCTPFLGAGASRAVIGDPSHGVRDGDEIAEEWRTRFEVPTMSSAGSAKSRSLSPSGATP
jgi:hypothetical protein